MRNILKRIITKSKSKFIRKVPVVISLKQTDELKNKNAIITGGSSGIGYAIAEAFLAAGAYVVITGRNAEKLRKRKNDLELEYPGRVFAYVLDNTDVSRFSSAILEIEKIVNKPINVLVNNAGVGGNTFFPNVSEQDYDSVMDTNLKGAFFLAQSFSKYLVKNKIQGNILNIGSSSSYRPGTNPYIFSKWGIRSMTLGMAKALIGNGIVVNGIAPGPTATPMLTKDFENLNEPRNPAGRYSTVQEVASLARLLVSDSGRMIVGDMVAISGGAGIITFDD